MRFQHSFSLHLTHFSEFAEGLRRLLDDEIRSFESMEMMLLRSQYTGMKRIELDRSSQIDWDRPPVEYLRVFLYEIDYASKHTKLLYPGCLTV